MAVQKRQIKVSVAKQQLQLYCDDNLEQEYSVSTAKLGVGQIQGSECTPLGKHKIRAKIGARQPINSVFVGRRPTGEIYNEALQAQYPGRDWILTRILWLCGTQIGHNRFGEVDTMRRYIYIHGAPDSHPMGVPSSHGCIKMRNQDVIELFDLVEVSTPVDIIA